MKKAYLLVDVSNLLHRYWHAIPALSSARTGIQTHVIFGWVNFLIEHRKKIPFVPKDAELIAFFDDGGTETGAKLIEGYKAHREPKPESFTQQLPFVDVATRLMGARYVKEKGHEADHLLGRFVLSQRGQATCFMLTSDKDMLQLVDDDTFAVKSENGGTYKKMDRNAVYERWKVWPETIPDLLLCMGDDSDGIPNVPGVGEKTAQALLTQYGTVERILANTDKLKPKIRDAFEACREQIAAARQLVTFTNEPVTVRQKPFDLEKMLMLCRELDMSKTLGKLMDAFT